MQCYEDALLKKLDSTFFFFLKQEIPCIIIKPEFEKNSEKQEQKLQETRASCSKEIIEIIQI